LLRFLLRRTIETLLLLLFLSILIFGLFESIPGDYLSEMELNPSIPSERIEELRSIYGLDQPVHLKYLNWVSQCVQGNLGYSFAQQRPALNLILDRLGNTLLLALVAFLITMSISFPLAIWTALRAGSWQDNSIRVLSLLGLSLPTVLVGLFGLYFAYWTGWFPIGGMTGLRSILLPAITLALPLVAFFLRTLRLELLDAFSQVYVVAALSRGLPRARVTWHALRNALNPVISMLGLLLGALLGGSVVVEKIFNWPGLGALTVTSILQRDLFVALNSVLIAAVLVVIANLVAEVVLAWVDPRVRLR